MSLLKYLQIIQRDYSADYKVRDLMPQQTHPVIKVHHAQVALVHSGLDDA
jgi:hypothetical protein